MLWSGVSLGGLVEGLWLGPLSLQEKDGGAKPQLWKHRKEDRAMRWDGEFGGGIQDPFSSLRTKCAGTVVSGQRLGCEMMLTILLTVCVWCVCMTEVTVEA